AAEGTRGRHAPDRRDQAAGCGAMREHGATFNFPDTVTKADTAAAVKPITADDFPAVLATTKCIALLELAAGRLLKAELRPGQVSVGVVVQVKHTAATPVGAGLEAEATYQGRNGETY